MNPKLVILCITTLLLLIPIAGATYDVVSGIASNSTEYTTTANYVELHNISLATGIGTVFIKASWDARMNFTAPLYGRFMRDGASLGRFNLTQSVYAQVGSYELALNETTGTHYYGWEVYSNKRGTIYSRNFSAVFLKNGTYGTTLNEVNSSAQISRSQVTGQEGVDTTQNNSISNLQVNDSYFNGSVFPNSTNFRNNSALQISTYSGNFPNTTIAGYNGNYPNSSLVNYLLIATYSGNYPNTTLGSKEATWDAKTTLSIVNSSAQISRSQVTGQEGVDTTQNNSISNLQVNDSYFNGTAFPNSTSFRNDSISGKMSNPATADLNMNNYSITNISNVGIGTTSPGSTMGDWSPHFGLDIIKSTGESYLRIANTYPSGNATGMWLHPNIGNAGWIVGTNNYAKLRLNYGTGVGEGEAMTDAKDDNTGITIQPDGNVGIGTTSPSEKLDVAGNIAVSGTVDGADISGNLVNWNATYNSTYAALLINAPNATVAANLANWNATYNATYAIGGGAISFSNGTNNIATGTKKKKRMITAGTITALYVNQTNDDACSGNITVSSSGTNKAYIAWSSVANVSSTGLTATFNQDEWLMYNMTENTGCKDFTFEQVHTKTS